MIGRLRGAMIQKFDGHVMIDVGGVGYVVYCSDRTIASLPSQGQEAIIHTDLQVREDSMQLFGFATTNEREWYRLLTSVQGVGAKAALAILGTIGIQTLARALTIGDVNTVRAAPGVGPKLAARIANELQDKAAKLMGTISADKVVEDFEPVVAASISKSVNAAPVPPKANHEAEAISALVNLGYDRVIAAQTIGNMADQELGLNELITAALRAMAPKG